MKELIILTDYDDNFLISVPDLRKYTTMDISKIERYFDSKNFTVKIFRYADLDLELDYKGTYVLYQTSETPGAFYKGFIEDIILYLEKRGAIVLPKYDYLKAHHNKVFMEFLRLDFHDSIFKTIKSNSFGSRKEALDKLPKHYPVIVKQASGLGSEGVLLARNEDEYRKCVGFVSEALFFPNRKRIVIYFVKKVLSIVNKKYNVRYVWNATRKIVVQNFIDGLKGDYKVLVFGERYYMLYRQNRKNDFRASGGGRLSFEIHNQKQEGLLNFARKFSKEIDFPILGIDIGFDGKAFHLIEFQMIHLGPYTLQGSNWWYEYNDNKWVRYEGQSDLEEVFSKSIYEYIDTRSIKQIPTNRND